MYNCEYPWPQPSFDHAGSELVYMMLNLTHGARAVSYTHLDVYKRQISGLIIKLFDII